LLLHAFLADPVFPFHFGIHAEFGRGLARVNTADWSIEIFAQGSFARPIDVRFSLVDGRLYILDFGKFEMGPQGRALARRGTGKVCVADQPLA